MMHAATRYRGLAALLAVCVAAACAPAQRPHADLAAAIVSEQAMAARFHLNTAWWRAYGSENLNRTVDLALKRNTDLAASAVAVRKAQYEARLSTTDLMPVFSSNASASTTRNLKAGRPMANGETWQQSWQGSVSVNYELDLWQRLRDAHDAKAWEYAATAQDLAAARLALINSVTSAWFKLLYTEQAIKLVDRNITAYKGIFNITQARHRLGKVAVVEPLQAEQALLNARNTLATLRTQRAETLQSLRNLCDLRPGEPLFLPEQADIMALTDVGVDLNVPVAALAARPDIHAAEARLEGALKTVAQNRAAWFPSMTIGSTLSLSATEAKTFFNVPLLLGMASLSLPFLDWNTLLWNAKISEADLETARLTFVSSLTTALNEVDAACASYVLARQTLQQTESVHDRDQRIAIYYGARYNQGKETLKNYLDAVATANTSELSVLSARYTVFVWENTIYKAMGGRYEPL